MSLPAFLAFPGQGSQHLSMLSKGGILDTALSNSYKEAVECCSDLISHNAVQLIEDGPEELINKTSVTQPLLVLCSYLHHQNLQERLDINPICMAGHSLGEYSALVAADSISIFSALRLVRKRGELMESAPAGSMSAILGLECSLIEDLCVKASKGIESKVQCANINSPTQTVISGHQDAIERAQELCLERGAKRAIKLKVSIASHSPLMLEAANEFQQTIELIEVLMPKIPILHNISASKVDNIKDLKTALIAQLHSPVRWVETCIKISSLNLPVIECGPGKVLSGLFKANKVENYYSSSDDQFYEKISNYG
jgi:[acyl-carrier-protein] S-malonyltransferase